MEWDFYQRDFRRREPVIFAVAFCVSDQIYSPLSGESMGNKASFVYVIIIIDIIVVLIFICYINFLERRFKQYAEVFDKASVEMRDFTLEISGLPNDFLYGGKDQMLCAHLWNHFEKHVKEAMEATAIQTDNEERLT